MGLTSAFNVGCSTSAGTGNVPSAFIATAPHRLFTGSTVNIVNKVTP